MSLVVLTGWGGQISLGQFALVGVGAIVAGNLVSRWNVDLFVTLAVAAAAGSLAALLLGIPALRIRGPFLAVVTLAFAVVLDGYVLNPNVFPDLIPQDVTRPLLWARLDLEDERYMLWFCLAVLSLGVVLARGVRRSRSGRLLIAARDNGGQICRIATHCTEADVSIQHFGLARELGEGWLRAVATAEAVPEDRRAALAERDLLLRRSIVERDPANVVAERLLGPALTRRLVAALWGGDED